MTVMDERSEKLLADTATLRRRARADRHAYWFPLLFFGLAIVGSAPLYVDQLQTQDADAATALHSTTDPRLGSYWTVVLLGGALLTVWWYRRRGHRIGIEGRVGPAVVAATLVTIAFLVAGALPIGFSLWPLLERDYTALLVIAVGLLALGREERSRGLWATAGLFATAAVLANTYDVQNLAFRLGWDPYLAHPDQVRFVQLPALVLPATVLLVGAAVAGLHAWRGR